MTTPPFWVPAPAAPLATLLLIGNLLGSEVSQVTWLVTSRMVGAVEKVAIARNCPLSVSEPKAMPLGMTVRETMLPPLPPVPPPDPDPPEVPPVLVLDPLTVMTVLELTGPLKAVAAAVMVAVPGLTAVTSPEPLTVATAGTVELQVTAPVMFWVDEWLALPKVPVAVSCTVWVTARD